MKKLFLKEYGFGIKKNEAKMVLLSKLIRTLASIGSSIERLSLMGKTKKDFFDTKEGIMDSIHRDVNYAKKLLIK